MTGVQTCALPISGDWLLNEQYLTISGWVIAQPEAQEPIRQALLTNVPTNRGITIKVLGRGWDVDKQVFGVRRYDAPKFDQRQDRLKFSLPVVCPDPLRYGLAPLTGSFGIYVGANFYETFTGSGFAFETFTGTGFVNETFLGNQPVTPFPPALVLTSAGSYSSKRVTVDMVGPLTSGDWYLLQETAANRRLWLPFTIPASVTLSIDCYERRVTVNGIYDRALSGRLRGEMLTLEAGGNLYKLVTGSTNGIPYATIRAYEAYQ